MKASLVLFAAICMFVAGCSSSNRAPAQMPEGAQGMPSEPMVNGIIAPGIPEGAQGIPDGVHRRAQACSNAAIARAVYEAQNRTENVADCALVQVSAIRNQQAYKVEVACSTTRSVSQFQYAVSTNQTQNGCRSTAARKLNR